jgi:hypothetical protein
MAYHDIGFGQGAVKGASLLTLRSAPSSKLMAPVATRLSASALLPVIAQK